MGEYYNVKSTPIYQTLVRVNEVNSCFLLIADIYGITLEYINKTSI